MSAREIPVLVLAGGLGSGKTTLLNHLLLERVERLGVIINDFGEINVDAFLVNSHVDATAAISGSCLCCIEDTSELDDALTTLAAADLEAIVVEASGLAEPGPLAALIADAPVDGIAFGGIVQLVDAAAWATGTLPAREHLRVASLIGVTKVDRLPEGRVPEDLMDAIREHAPSAPIIPITEGRVDPTWLFDVVAERTDAQPTLAAAHAAALRDEAHHSHAHDHTHEHDHWQQLTLDVPDPVDPDRLVDLLANPPRGVYRIKGAAWTDIPWHRDRWVVQGVGGWFRFTRDRWPAGDPRTTRLVAIGADIDTAAVRSALTGVLSADGELDANRATVLLRYAERPGPRPQEQQVTFDTVGPSWWPDPESDGSDA